MADAKPVQKISAADLCVLTGLTDRRHRQLAKDGYFPAPEAAEYAYVATLRGLFRYYREHNLRTKEKIVLSKDKKTQLEMRLMQLRYDREVGNSIPRADVNKMLARDSALIRSRCYAALEREFPGRLVGRTAQEIAAVGRALADELVAIIVRPPEEKERNVA